MRGNTPVYNNSMQYKFINHLPPFKLLTKRGQVQATRLSEVILSFLQALEASESSSCEGMNERNNPDLHGELGRCRDPTNQEIVPISKQCSDALPDFIWVG